MKGIILAGGAATRLYPITQGLSKQLLPIYNKPMIYYPLSILMLAKIRNILIIVKPEDITLFKRLLGTGSQFGINLTYAIQHNPNGLAQAFLIGEDFINGDRCCLILGDNIYFGRKFSHKLHQIIDSYYGATLFAYQVKDPKRFGIVIFDGNFKAIALEEKPNHPSSCWAITGLYFYDHQVVDYAKRIKPSIRGELEITNINQIYLEQGLLHIELLGQSFVWLDMGTYDSLIEASIFVQSIEKRQKTKIACLEEIGWHNGWLDSNDVLYTAKKMLHTEYGQYLRDVLHVYSR